MKLMPAIFLFSLLFFFSSLASASEHKGPPPVEILRLKADLLQAKLDTQSSIIRSEGELRALREGALDKRIDDLSNRIADIGNSVDRFSLIATLLLAASGLLGYLSVVAKAKKEAQESAKKWFEENERGILGSLDALSERVEEARRDVEERVKTVKDVADIAQADIQSTIANLQRRLDTDSKSSLSPASKGESTSAIQTKANEIRQEKPESQYTFEDWNIRAFAAYTSGKESDAVYYWDKAAKAPNTPLLESLKASLNKAVVLNELKRKDEALAEYDQLIARSSNSDESAAAEFLARALFNRGVTYSSIGRDNEAIQNYDEVSARFSSSTNPIIRDQLLKSLINRAVSLGRIEGHERELAEYRLILSQMILNQEDFSAEHAAKAMLNTAITLNQLERPEEAIQQLSDLVSRLSGIKDDPVRELIAQALISRGVTKAKLGQFESANSDFDLVVLRCSLSSNPTLKEQLLRALINKGVALGSQGKPNEEIAAYEAIIAQFESDPDQSVRAQVATAMNNKATTLRTLNRDEEAIAECDQITSKYALDSSNEARRQLSRAMLTKATSLAKLNKSEEAIAQYQALIEKFEANEEDLTQENFAFALNGLGFELLRQAKASWSSREQSVSLLTKSQHYFLRASEVLPDIGMILGNQAYSYWLLGNREMATELFRKALGAKFNGGQEIYHATLLDLEIHPVDVDAEFRTLIDALFQEFSRDA